MQARKYEVVRTGVQVYKGENIDRALRRFKKAVERARKLEDLREREYYEKPSIANKRARASAVKREQRRVQEQRNKILGIKPKKEKEEKKRRNEQE